MKIEKLSKGKIESHIKVWAKYSGIGFDLEKDDYAVIKSLLNSRFNHLSLKLINDAFLNYSAGLLGKIEHYGTFSPKFVGSVIQAQKEKSRLNNTIITIDASHQIEHKVNKEEENKGAFEFIARVKKDTGEFPVIANWSGAFLYAEKEGIINLTSDQKEKIRDEVVKDIEAQIKYNRSVMKDFSGLVKELDPGNIKNECRKKAMIVFFANAEVYETACENNVFPKSGKR